MRDFGGGAAELGTEWPVLPQATVIQTKATEQNKFTNFSFAHSHIRNSHIQSIWLLHLKKY